MPERSSSPSKFFTSYYGSAVLFLIAGFLVAAFFILRPLIIGVKETNAETESTLTSLANQRRYLTSLEQSVAAAQSIPAAALAQVTDALPNEAGAPSLLLAFSAAAARNGVQIGNMAFSEPKALSPAARAATTTVALSLPLNINLSLRVRNYDDVKRFLADLESSLRLLDVVGISSGAVGKDGALSYQLDLRTYVFSPPKP